MNESNKKSIQKVWGISKADMPVIDVITDKFQIKHGMFASIPLICRGKRCPYSETCPIPENQRTENERCYVEIGAILSRFDSWCKHFNIECEGERVKDEDLVDVTLIRDLIDIEIQIVRAENKLAINGDFIGDTLQEVDKQGNPWYVKMVTPEAEYKMTLLEKRQKVLNQLNATRKDKAASMKNASETNASNAVFNKIKDIVKSKNVNLDDLDFDEEGDVNE